MMAGVTRKLTAIFVATVLCGLLAGCQGEWVKKERTLGYRGEARYNPFLAAEWMLNDLGFWAASEPGYTELPPTDEALMVPASAVRAKAVADELERWVAQGGHLIYIMMAGEGFRNDWDESFEDWLSGTEEEEEEDEESPAGDAEETDKKAEGEESKDSAGDDDAEAQDGSDDDSESEVAKRHPFLTAVGVELTDSSSETNRPVRMGRDRYSVDLPATAGFRLDRELKKREFEAGEPGKAYFLSFRHRMGRVSVLANGKPFRNRWIGERDNAAFLHRLVTLNSKSGVTMIYASQTSLWDLLWSRGWMPLVALIVATLVWLWRNMPRFGAVKALAPVSSRDFSEHIAMTAKFLWDYKNSDVLLESPRRYIRSVMARRWMQPGDSEEEHYGRLAERTGLSAQRVREAMNRQDVFEPAAMTRLMQDLQTIESVL